MYELHCPSCRTPSRSSFIRVGAATRCESCGHTWRISDSHFHRIGEQGDAAAGGEPKLDTPPPQPEDARSGSSVTGMSGLSDLMQSEPNRPADVSTPPIREAKFASAEAARNLAASAANLKQAAPAVSLSRQSRRLAILIIALLAFGVALAGIGLVTLGGDSDAATPTADDTESSQNQSAGTSGNAVETAQDDPLLDHAGPPSPGQGGSE
ncbi:MAG: hypothetical protein AAGH99_05870 [Planctomycetota bacterium]